MSFRPEEADLLLFQTQVIFTADELRNRCNCHLFSAQMYMRDHKARLPKSVHDNNSVNLVCATQQIKRNTNMAFSVQQLLKHLDNNQLDENELTVSAVIKIL